MLMYYTFLIFFVKNREEREKREGRERKEGIPKDKEILLGYDLNEGGKGHF